MSELSDEEKKAIEYLKRHILPYYGSKGRIEFMLNDIILNLIEKQSKEIEEYKKLLDDRLWNEHISKETNNKWKDKIKTKIEEYNKMINATYEDLTPYADYRRDVCFEIKNVLNELLEE